jgi:hypothetical protein
MSVKKIIILAIAAVFLATPAFADNIPEFDAVACDSSNIFAVDAALTYGAVSANNIAADIPLVPINGYSDWFGVGESFTYDGAGQRRIDACFQPDPEFPANPDLIYRSYVTPFQQDGTYTWRFVLQMTPESDININIYDCVLKPQGTDIFSEAQQTGRVNLNGGLQDWFRSQNPRMTVKALTASGDFIMTARTMPNLRRVCMRNRLYTSKAHWDEGIIVTMPEEGKMNRCGGSQYDLEAGDVIEVKVQVSEPHPATIMYGQDNVLLKYIGVVGTEVIRGDFPADPNGACDPNFPAFFP